MPAADDGYAVDLVLPEDDTDHDAHDHEHEAGDVRHGFRDYRYPMPAAGRHAVVPRPPDGLHRPAGLAGAGRASTCSATTRRTRCDLPRGRPGPAADDHRPGVRPRTARSRYPSLTRTCGTRTGSPPTTTPGCSATSSWSTGRPGRCSRSPPPATGCGCSTPPTPAATGSAWTPAAGRPAFVQIGSDGGLLAAPIEHAEIPIAAGRAVRRRRRLRPLSGRHRGHAAQRRSAAGAADAVMRFRVIRARPTRRQPGPGPAGRRSSRCGRRPGRPYASGGSAAAGTATSALADQRAAVRPGPDGRPPSGSARSRSGASAATCTTPCTCTSTRSRCSAGAAPARGPATPAGRTPSTSWPGETVEVAIRFTDYAGRYMLHCHNLEHEDMAMMAAFQTIAP